MATNSGSASPWRRPDAPTFTDKPLPGNLLVCGPIIAGRRPPRGWKKIEIGFGRALWYRVAA